jgi:hypothetical protein
MWRPMSRPSIYATLLALATTMSLSGPAKAQEASQKDEGSLGAMVFLGGNFFTTPDNRQIEERTGVESDGLGFSGDAGGFGWGVGVYGEVRVMEHLGFQLGVGYDQSILTRDVDFTSITPGSTSTVVIEEHMTMRGLRFPMLVKGIIPTTFGRVWAGVGPEAVVMRWVEGEIVGAPASVTGSIHPRKASSLMLLFGLGAVFNVGDTVELPIELRASRSLSQGSDWADRVEVAEPPNENPTYNPYTVKAQSTWDFRLALGLGFRL